jgi:GTPase SAR1 family protein
MKYLVFAGPGDVGKTTIIGRMARSLISQGFKVVDEGISTMPDNSGYGLPKKLHDDFYVLLEKNGKFIVLYSWGDNEKVITWLANYLKELYDRGLRIFLVIMATRDGSEGLYNFTSRVIGLDNSNRIEIPMGRMVRGTRRSPGLDWYVNSLSNIIEASILPGMLE